MRPIALVGGLHPRAAECPPRSPAGRSVPRPAAASGPRHARLRPRDRKCKATGCRASCGPSSQLGSGACTRVGQCSS